jgi:hypothetical protein
MNNKLGFVRLGALAVVCAVGFGLTQFAHADGFSIGYRGGWHDHGRSSYSVSIGLGSGYYGGGYYAPRYYAPRYYAPVYYAPPAEYYYPGDSYYDDDGPGYSYDDDYPSYGYYDGYPAYSISYSDYGYGRGHGYDRGYRGHERSYRHDGDRRHHR